MHGGHFFLGAWWVSFLAHANLDIWNGKVDYPNRTTGEISAHRPPIITDSGATGAVVVGKRWLTQAAKGPS